MFQNCEIFLCGTKLDLIQNGESERMVSNDSATDYAKGEELYMYSKPTEEC